MKFYIKSTRYYASDALVDDYPCLANYGFEVVQVWEKVKNRLWDNETKRYVYDFGVGGNNE